MGRKYDYPLTNWACASLYRKNLEEMVDSIRNDNPVDSILTKNFDGADYMGTIITEESIKMFSEPDRPVIEVILNAIDAKPIDVKGYRVEIKATSSKLSIADEGESMNLDDILTLLIIPFSTQKDENDEHGYIGRFGVGFFSTLNYCVQNPGSSVILTTNKGGESYEARFYAQTKDISSLRLMLRKIKPKRQGTTVTIEKSFDMSRLKGYLTKNLKDIPPFKAHLSFNDEVINSLENNWYISPLKLKNKKKNTESNQEIAIQVAGTNNLYFTSQGVNVQTVQTPAKKGLNILMPPLVGVTIGRDNFLKDENYYASAKAAFIAFQQAIENDYKLSRQDAIELIPSLLSSFGLAGLNEIPNLNTLISKLIHGKKYVMLEEEYQKLHGFTGYKLEQEAFFASPQSCSVWSRMYKQYADFIKSNFTFLESLSYADFLNKIESTKGYYPNLKLLFKEIDHHHFKDHDIGKVHLVEFEPPCLPFMYDPAVKEFYINARHSHIAGPYNSLKVNSAVSRYLQLPHIRQQFTGPGYIQEKMLDLRSEMKFI